MNVKKKIVEQSIQLFEMKGFSETSIQDIVEALGVTKGTFYYYFDSKEQLLKDIHLTYIDDLLKLQEQIIGNSDMNYKTKLFETVKLLITQIKVTGRPARVFHREMMHLKPESVSMVKQKRKMFRLNMQKIIESGIESGEFRKDLRADLVTFAILGMCNWSYNWFDPNGPVTDEELVKTYMETLLNGISS
ncbi:TetR family transcriptional regulator [Marinithermofilum abyssi]|uniref:TetR family transcriptional regulator n=1 Tax=Marinithermofilum abyssi TaxID=1571185 RepID=A0A8J2VH73_9BACL|nr:TetR/AcrR family transcriptional regulator [Marinithermofilum abyssi]GGE12451.1 TetR family transcriptional regulator [Marinithermofilum abyssi]